MNRIYSQSKTKMMKHYREKLNQNQIAEVIVYIANQMERKLWKEN